MSFKWLKSEVSARDRFGCDSGSGCPSVLFSVLVPPCVLVPPLCLCTFENGRIQEEKRGRFWLRAEGARIFFGWSVLVFWYPPSVCALSFSKGGTRTLNRTDEAKLHAKNNKRADLRAVRFLSFTYWLHVWHPAESLRRFDVFAEIWTSFGAFTTMCFEQHFGTQKNPKQTAGSTGRVCSAAWAFACRRDRPDFFKIDRNWSKI